LLVLMLAGVMVWDVARPAASKNAGDAASLAVGGELVLDYFTDRKFDPRGTNYHFGLVLVKEKDPVSGQAHRKLTYQENGSTNNTCVRVDGQDFQYGKLPGHRPSVKAEKEDRASHLWQTSWLYDDEGVLVTQRVQIVAGAQSGQLDTCLVRYTVQNKGTQPHKVGVRVLLDTFIGANDGVPFAIPGRAGLLTRPEVFEGDRIPDYVQALERPDLQDPGTVAHLGLKGIEIPHVQIEPIARLVVRPWSNTPAWDMPPLEEEARNQPIKDSCVVLYWPERDMKPGEARELAFTYGLNAITVPEGTANLALTVGGSFVAGNTFTAVAYVKDPQPDQKVKLIVPEGLSLVAGQKAEQVVPAAEGQGGVSQVSWRVRSERAGTYALQAVTGITGVQHKVTISNSSLFR
jgi:hypothetical protein